MKIDNPFGSENFKKKKIMFTLDFIFLASAVGKSVWNNEQGEHLIVFCVRKRKAIDENVKMCTVIMQRDMG